MALKKGNMKMVYKNRSSALRKIAQLGLINNDLAEEYQLYSGGTVWILRIKNEAVMRLNLREKGYFVK